MRRFSVLWLIALLIVLSASHAFAAISLVQHAANEGNGVTSLSCSSGSPVAWASSGNGNLIVIQMFSYDGVSFDSVSDGGVNTYTQAYGNSGSGEIAALYYAANSVSGATTITVTIHTASASYLSIRCTEWSGIDTTSPFDDFIPDTGGLSTTHNSPWGIPNTAAVLSKTFTNAVANELFIGNAQADTGSTTISTDSSWTVIDNRTQSSFANLNQRNDYMIVSAISTYNSSNKAYFGTVSSGNVVCNMAAFKAASVSHTRHHSQVF